MLVIVSSIYFFIYMHNQYYIYYFDSKQKIGPSIEPDSQLYIEHTMKRNDERNAGEIG